MSLDVCMYIAIWPGFGFEEGGKAKQALTSHSLDQRISQKPCLYVCVRLFVFAADVPAEPTPKQRVSISKAGQPHRTRPVQVQGENVLVAVSLLL